MHAISSTLVIVIIVIIIIASGLGVFALLRVQTSSQTEGNCSTHEYPNGVPEASSFHLSEKSTLTICVRFFYYGNLTKINSSQIMQVTANNANHTDFTNEDENFTVIGNPSTFQIGGASNLNEGLVVTYQIQAHPNSQGSYMFSSLQWLVPSNAECGPDYVLIVGNGIPDYVLFGTCIGMTNSSNVLRTFDNSSFYCPSSDICTEITGSDNQTAA